MRHPVSGSISSVDALAARLVRRFFVNLVGD